MNKEVLEMMMRLDDALSISLSINDEKTSSDIYNLIVKLEARYKDEKQ